MSKKINNVVPNALPHIPPTLPGILLDWYDKNARALPWRKDTVPYRVWISEIMLQQTGAEVVSKYFIRFLEAFPTLEALAAAEEEKVMKLWEGLGYYSRARNLMKTAKIIADDYAGQFPEKFEDIIKLPGVGPYTAGAIASISFEQPVAAVDGNVARIISRIAGITETDKDRVKKSIASSLKDIYPAQRRGDFTQSLMELGALVCVPNGMPKCSVCPVLLHCAAYKDGTASKLPLRQIKPAKKLEEVTVLLLLSGDAIALRRRDNAGLLAGLWELPNVMAKLTDSEAVTLAAQWGTKPAAIIRASNRTHIFTHIKWDMVCYTIECDAQPSCFTWADRRMLSETYTLPTAFKKFLEDY